MQHGQCSFRPKNVNITANVFLKQSVLFFQSTAVEMVSNNMSDAGVEFVRSNTIIASDNAIRGSRIGLGFSTNAIISGNNVSNSQAAISMDYSSNSTILQNNLSNNGFFSHGAATNASAIDLFFSNTTRIYHNNLVNNKFQAFEFAGYGNSWDAGYPVGGNYWSDYTGVDNCSGPTQSICPSPDGIGDTPYVISTIPGIPGSSSSKDRYPLIRPFQPVLPAVQGTLELSPDSINVKSMSRYLTALIELPMGFNLSDIDLSSIHLNGTIPIVQRPAATIGDNDLNGIPDLTIKFNMSQVKSLFRSPGNYTLQVTGRLGRSSTSLTFIASDTLSLLLPGDINHDGKVDISDLVMVGTAFGTSPRSPGWIPSADINRDGRVDIVDFTLVASQFGQTI
jgi:parallel beta-helix repeat protein